MYRAIIADDEDHVLHWVQDLLDTNLPEMDSVAVSTGTEALGLFDRGAFDIAILDIIMPGINGIETAKRLLERSPSCRILLLTGYDEFDLIYQVNHIRNIRYSLKTETDGEIIQKVREMLAEIEEERRQRQIIDSARRRELLVRHFEQRGMLFDILFESSSVENMQAKLSWYGPSLRLSPGEPVSVALVQFPHPNFSRQVITNDLLLRLYQVMEPDLGQYFRFSLLDMNRDCVLLLAQASESRDPAEHAGLLKTELDRCLVALEDRRVPVVRFFVSGRPVPWRRVDKIYSFLLQHCRYHGMEQSISPVFGAVLEPPAAGRSGANRPASNSAHGQYTQLLQRLSGALARNDPKEFRESLRRLRELVPALCAMTMAQQAELRGQLSLVLVGFVNSHELAADLEQKLSFSPLYQAMSALDWNEFLGYVQRLGDQIFTLSQERVKNESDYTVSRICQYISKHLSEDLSVTRLSEVFNYNPSYFSRLFKQAQGEPLSQYLRTARLNRAQELLRTTSLSIQEIASQVGFDTVQYFSMVFRKETGMTPKAYRLS